MADTRVLIVIPAYNEAENIEWVINELMEVCPEYDYVIVNDGSKDSTIEICKKNNFEYIDLPVNLGLSGAVACGMQYALLNDYDAVIQYDGDGQHCPQYITELKKAIEDGWDVAIGSRFVNEKRPHSLRMIGSVLISTMIFLTTGHKLSDPTSGMRMFSKRVVKEFVSDINYGPEPDTISYLAQCGAKIKEIQVKMRDRVAGDSYLSSIKAVSYMTQMALSIMFAPIIRRKKAFNE